MSVFDTVFSSVTSLSTQLKNQIKPINNTIFQTVKSPVSTVASIPLIAAGLFKSPWGSKSQFSWNNADSIVSSRAKESTQYQSVDRTVGEIKKAYNIKDLSKVEDVLENKANENNTITQSTLVEKRRTFGNARISLFQEQYQVANDPLLQKYGYETYARKSELFNESLNWMKVKDMNKLSNNTFLPNVQDSTGQDLEREIAYNRMNNYFGQYYVDAERV